MWRKLRIWMGILGVVALLAAPVAVLGATSATVTVNATPQFVSISLNDTTHAFGVVAASATPNTGTAHFGITNASTIITDNTIVANGWTGGTGWTWGAAGADTGRLKASDGDGAYDVTVDETTPIALKNAVAATTNWAFELQLEAPSSFTFGDIQETTVTIAASAA